MKTDSRDVVITYSCAWLQRAKTHAQRQRLYRERKKAREGEAFLRRERERQRKYAKSGMQRQRDCRLRKKAQGIERTEMKQIRGAIPAYLDQPYW